MRAVIMITFYLIGKIFWKTVYLPNILLTAFIFALILKPLEIFNIGFQLSFICAAALIIGAYFSEQFAGFQNKFVKTIIIFLFAQLAALPLVSFYFGILPITGVLINLAVAPLAELALGYSLVFLILLSIYSSELFKIIGYLLVLIFNLIIKLSDFFVNLGLFNHLNYSFSFKTVIVIYLIYAIILILLTNKKTEH